MPERDRKGSIEIAEDVDFQRTSWRVQRAGWTVMLAIAVASMFGVCGGGPLSSAETGDAESGMSVSYERFTRLYGKQTLDFRIPPTATLPDSTLKLWIDRSWIESAEITMVTPEPERTELAADRLVFTFRAQPGDSSLRARFDARTRAFGIVRGRAGIQGGPTHEFTQLAYP